MANARWTFETLARADRAMLEAVLLQSRAPDPARLSGWAYNGYNHDWLGQLANTKFRKVFFTEGSAHYGLNQMVAGNGRGYTGEWRVKQKRGKPVELGYFRVVPAGSIERSAPYEHLLCLDYDVDRNPRWNLLMRAIRDFVGLPNDEDYGVILGKGYLRLLPGKDLFASYFILGAPEQHARP